MEKIGSAWFAAGQHEMSLDPFHLAIPVTDLGAARAFYGDVLGCPEGRSTPGWIDFDFFGHQLVVHLSPDARQAGRGAVDGHGVPVPHFGVVLTMERWEALVERLRAANVAFALEPQIRFKGKPGEQATFFFLDPSGNALEIKAFHDRGQLFAT
ncbi:MAG TPA: VOC family protein [Hyphomonadaceae bacterium]|nr:VOC family protein [Hyphomonadaceae bacterium]